jgi:hypothetical protein
MSFYVDPSISMSISHKYSGKSTQSTIENVSSINCKSSIYRSPSLRQCSNLAPASVCPALGFVKVAHLHCWKPLLLLWKSFSHCCHIKGRSQLRVATSTSVSQNAATLCCSYRPQTYSSLFTLSTLHPEKLQWTPMVFEIEY